MSHELFEAETVDVILLLSWHFLPVHSNTTTKTTKAKPYLIFKASKQGLFGFETAQLPVSWAPWAISNDHPLLDPFVLPARGNIKLEHDFVEQLLLVTWKETVRTLGYHRITACSCDSHVTEKEMVEVILSDRRCWASLGSLPSLGRDRLDALPQQPRQLKYHAGIVNFQKKI